MAQTGPDLQAAIFVASECPHGAGELPCNKCIAKLIAESANDGWNDALDQLNAVLDMEIGKNPAGVPIRPFQVALVQELIAVLKRPVPLFKGE